MKGYEAVIGLEIHVQAKSETKIFCSCKNEYGAKPNSNVCPICLGYPGVLPTLNKFAMEQILKAGLMTDCKINYYSKFDRKSYYYPDQPKNYQITQFDLPFCYDGKIPIGGKGFSGEMIEERYIGMERIHLEEDVGKSIHHKNYSVIDFNRAGVPLLETVSMPEMHTADEAYAYMSSLQQIMRYGGISDCDQEKGQMRCDVNISVHKPNTPFGTKVEIKNLNSNRHVWLSINYEIERQIEAVENGEEIKQETRRWDDAKGCTTHMRFKETADDYRYFPEPDLPDITIDKTYLEELKKDLPLTPKDYRKLFIEEFKVTEYDAHVLTLDKVTADFFMNSAKQVKKPKQIANIMMNQLNSLLSNDNLSLDQTSLKEDHLVSLVNLAEKNIISKNSFSKILPILLKEGGKVEDLAKKLNLIIEQDTSLYDTWLDEVLKNNPKAIAEFKSGKENAIQYLMGQVMKMSQGKANPPQVIKLLREKLNNL